MSGDVIHVAMDETAMVAAGAGNVKASCLIHFAACDPSWLLYAPTCALVEADRARPGAAEHLASLPELAVLDLDRPAALAMGREVTWGQAHARIAAEPTPELPDGAFIATIDPDRWAGQKVRLIDLNP